MAELERLANHFGDIGAICNDAAFALMHAHCGVLRERTLRAADAAFGHRLMMDAVVPGGVAVDLRAGRRRGDPGAHRRGPLDVPEARRALRQHRLAAGPHGRDRRSAKPIWRASSARRRDRPRVRARFRRAARPSLFALRRAALRGSDAQGGRRQRPHLGPHRRGRRKPRPDRGRCSLACRPARSAPRFPPRGRRARAQRSSKAFAATSSPTCASTATARSRAAICATRRGFSGRCSEAAIEDNIVADFPLCNKSFNCSYSGHDL